MKTMIIYSSKTCHTEKIALAMGEQLGVTPINIIEKPVIENVDLLFIGSGIYSGKPSPELLKYIDNLSKDNVRHVVIFSTCTSGENQMQSVKELIASKGIPVNEKSFTCKGKFLFFSRKHPDQVDIQNSKNFAKEIVPL